MNNLYNRIAVLLACLVLGSKASASIPQDSARSFVGLWGDEQVLGPEVQGPLVLRKFGDTWQAEIQGHTARVEDTEGEFAFELAGGRGSYRGRIVGNELRGHWTQPVSLVHSCAFATPVTLHPVGDDVWQGQVVPLDDRVALYVHMDESEDGEVHASLRNPERNLGIFFDLGKVERRGNELLLFEADGEEVALRGLIAEDEQSWSLRLPQRGLNFHLTRRTRDTATGFYPRDASPTPYIYLPPLEGDDGWPVAHASDVGLDSDRLQALVQSVLDTEYENEFSPYIQGILIARRGCLVLDEYFYGFHRERPHDTRSSAKSLTALLTCIAMDHGAEFDPGTPVLEIFDDLKGLANVDERKRALNVEHLLTMRPGLACDDEDDSSPGNEDRMQSQEAQPDWIRYALDLPMVHEPGAEAVYCTAGIHLLGGVIERTMGMPLRDFIAEAYATPLEIRRYHLGLSPRGRAYMGGGIRFRPRDHMKLGQLMAGGGRWKGKQIVSEPWIQIAIGPHASINKSDDYGFGIWRTTLHWENHDYDVAYASGNGGQLVIAIPELELVVQFTGGNYQNFRTWGRFLTELVPQYVLDAVDDEAGSQ